MRLDKNEVLSIIEIIDLNMQPKKAELYLYGSRAKVHLKGGDIDLLILFENEDDYNVAKLKKIDSIVDLKIGLGDQKIDLTLAIKSHVETDPFLQIITEGAALLHTWR